MIVSKSGSRRARNMRRIVFLVGAISFAGAASAQSSNPFAFLFGGGSPAPREGRSAYAPPPAYNYGYGSPSYAALPGYSDPYAPEVRHPRPRAMNLDGVQHGTSPKEVMAAIKAVKPGKGPLGPFLNDPTLRAGDVVVTSRGLMVYRGGAGSGRSHAESDFVSVSGSSGLIASNKQTLISLETASRLTPQKPLGAETKSGRDPGPEMASSETAKARSATR